MAGISLLAGLLGTFLLGSVQAEVLTVPAEGPITSPFGWRSDPFTGGPRFHSGVDIGAPMNAPVFAPQHATVLYTGPYGGYGNVVVLEHPGQLFSLYGHLSQPLVQAGQQVVPGEAIGLVGSTGRSTGPHLHFEVYEPRQYLDPMQYLATIFSGGQPIAQQPAPRAKPQSQLSSILQTQSQDKSLALYPARSTAGKTSQTSKKGGKPMWTVQLVQGNNVKMVQF
jgi:hypothetical protein